MYINWLNPILFLLSFLGIKPFMFILGPDGKEILEKDPPEGEEEEETPPANPDEEIPPAETPEEEEEFELTDETNIYGLDNTELNEILERDDIDLNKYLELVKMIRLTKNQDAKILFKDIKKVLEPKPGDKPSDVKTETIADTKTGKDKTPALKPADQKPFTVDDKFIGEQVAKFKEKNKDKEPAQLERMTQEYRQILDGIKGQTSTSKLFNNYVNSQTYIKSIKSPFDANWKPDPNIVKQPEYIEKALKAKNAKLLSSIRSKYPDFPEDALSNNDTRLEFERELIRENPRLFRAYEDYFNDQEKQINDNYDKYNYVVENWERMAKDTIESDIKLFTGWLENQGIKPEEINLPDLTIDEKYYNPFLYTNVLYTKDKKPNTDVMTFMDGNYPIMKPMAVFRALQDHFLDSVIELNRTKAMQEGFNLGKDSFEPSLSESHITGETDKIEIEDNDDEDESLEHLNKRLEAMKASISGKKKRKI